MRRRIFDPLGMRDTAFHVPSKKLHRLPPAYIFDHQTSTLTVYDDVQNSSWASEPPLESGGGGLISTVDDYLAFCRMLLHGGRHRGKQIVSRATVALLTSDQLTPEQRVGAEPFFGAFGSWGFGMAVDIKCDQIFRSLGRFGWDGGLGTSAYTDPAQDTIGILFTQRLLESPEANQLFTDFWTLAYAGIK